MIIENFQYTIKNEKETNWGVFKINKNDLVGMFPESKYNYSECSPFGIYFIKPKNSGMIGGVISNFKAMGRSIRRKNPFASDDDVKKINEEQYLAEERKRNKNYKNTR